LDLQILKLEDLLALLEHKVGDSTPGIVCGERKAPTHMFPALVCVFSDEGAHVVLCTTKSSICKRRRLQIDYVRALITIQQDAKIAKDNAPTEKKLVDVAAAYKRALKQKRAIRA